jgi:cytochrome c6
MRIVMRSLSLLAAALLLVAVPALAQQETKGKAKAAAGKTGEQLFKENCASCHPDGGNIVNPAKTLKKKDREANKIRTAADVVKTMRNPGPGMPAFDPKTIPDKDARKIGEYVIKTF